MNLQNIKEFLKPNWRKITITLLFSVVYLAISYFVLLAYFSGYLSLVGKCFGIVNIGEVTNETRTGFVETERIMRLSIEMFRNSFTPIFYILSPGIGVLTTQVIIDEPFKILILTIYWYFLSCLAFWVHDKVKKK